MSAILHTKSAGDAPDDTAKLLRASVEMERMRKALRWYEEQARLCRLIHSEGDAGRQALSADGGERARAAIAKAQGGAA